MNADDFGLSPGVNAGVIAAHEQGIVTSASLMVRWPAPPRGRRLRAQPPGLGLGLHVDLGEWASRDGDWEPVYEVVPLERPRRGRGARCERSSRRFRELTGRDPTHLDSHQHVHNWRRPVASVFRRAGRELGVPLRHHDPRRPLLRRPLRPDADGEPIPERDHASETLIEIIAEPAARHHRARLPPRPGRRHDSVYDASARRRWRSCATRACARRSSGEGIALRSFADLRRAAPASR